MLLIYPTLTPYRVSISNSICPVLTSPQHVKFPNIWKRQGLQRLLDRLAIYHPRRQPWLGDRIRQEVFCLCRHRCYTCSSDFVRCQWGLYSAQVLVTGPYTIGVERKWKHIGTVDSSWQFPSLAPTRMGIKERILSSGKIFFNDNKILCECESMIACECGSKRLLFRERKLLVSRN